MIFKFLLLAACLGPVNFASAKKITVVINEVAWMGTKNSYADEWIELYNPNKSPVQLNGWTLKFKRGKVKIKLSGTIKAQSYFLLERTDDNAVLNVSADQIYAGGLNNDGEVLLLVNSFGETIDKIDCSLGWFAGSNETKKTMERINPLFDGCDPSNWKTSQKIDGTPRAKNSPQGENKSKREIKMISVASAYGNSDFSFVLVIGLSSSLIFSATISIAWLKIKKKKDKIKKPYSIC